jgi:hypothetical protein
MAQTVIQTSNNGQNSSAATNFTGGQAPTWTTQATTAGSDLCLLLGFAGNPGTVTVTGWTQQYLQNNGNAYCGVWKLLGAASQAQNTGPSISWTAAVNAVAGCLLETGGSAISSEQDGSNQTATGANTTPAGGALTTSNANDLIIVGLSQGATGSAVAATLSSPSAGYTLVQGSASDGVTGEKARVVCAFIYQVVTSTQSGITPGCTSNKTDTWTATTFAIKAAGSAPTPDILSPTFADGPQYPRSVPRLPRHGIMSDAGAAFFVNDPSTLNPANVPSWLPEDKPRPRALPQVQKAQDWCDPTSLLVLPAPIATGCFVDTPPLPRRLPRVQMAQDLADPTLLPVIPPALFSAVLEPDLQTPRGVPRLAYRQIESSPDFTTGYLQPGPAPLGYAAWGSFNDPGPRPVPRLSMREAYADPEPYQPVPDIFVFSYAVFDAPATLPRGVPRLPAGVRTEESFTAIVALAAQSQAWDVPSEGPRRVRQRVPVQYEASPVAPVVDGIDQVSGWRQDTAYVPRRLPRTMGGEYVSFIDIPAAYDPQSLAVPLSESAPRFVPRPRVQLYADPDPAGWIQGVITFLADPHAGAVAADSAVLPRRLPKGQPGETAFVLEQSFAQPVYLPFSDMPQVPKPVPRLGRQGEQAEPPWFAAVSIIVAGPYYAEALDLYNVNFAEAGQIITQ